MFKSKSRPPPLLDVEDDDQRQNRIGNILERLDTSPLSNSKSPTTFPNMISLPIEPPAALLARVRDFIPAIAASNEALSRQRREDIDIEHIAHDEHRYIEMNLGLGVFEAKRRRGPNVNTDMHSPSVSSEEDSASDRATDNDSSSGSELDSDTNSYDSEGKSDEYSSSDDDREVDDSDSESGSAASIGINHVSSRPIKPLPRRAPSQQAQQLPI